MPTFHRPPEWQQPADRHTRLIDPVLTVRQLSRFELSLKHVVRIDHALVFSTPKGGYEAYPPPTRPSRAEIASRRYTAVYEVDTGVHPFTDTLTLPSDNDAFEFTAEVDVSWQVLDPARFVASGIRDVPALLLGELQRAARPVARSFAIADSGRAEQELLNAVDAVGPLGAPAGLRTSWTLRVRRDQANIDHQQRLQAIDHSAAEQVRTAQQGMRVDAETDHRHRQQDELQAARALEYGRQQQELAMAQQRWHHERAMLQGQQLLELQQIEAKKIEFYQWHLSQGGVQAWALHLAQHPEDSRLVMSSMREDQLRMIQAQLDLVKELLAGEGAEKFELEGPKQLALRTVSDILNQRLPGVPQTPPLLPAPDQPAPAAAPAPPPSQEGGASPYDPPGSGPSPYTPPGSGPSPYASPTTPEGAVAPAPAPGAAAQPGTAPSPAPVPAAAPPGAAPAAAPAPPGAPYLPHAHRPPHPPYPPQSSCPPPPAPGPFPQQAAPPVPTTVPVPPASVPAAYPPHPTAPAWQPPPGYGTTPTAPAAAPTDRAAPPAAAPAPPTGDGGEDGRTGDQAEPAPKETGP
ncbi:hypothetical protein KYY02_01265 [Streptomyces pimonensis]|uniref:PE-PGRS family protein n=1 Tax=Streptomyces pimonensis TaxID=2860288 RepID=A0ABV4IVV1_9ACTN